MTRRVTRGVMRGAIVVMALVLISGATFLATNWRLRGWLAGRWDLAGERQPDGKPAGVTSSAASNEGGQKPGIDMSRTKLVGRARGVKQWELEAAEIRIQEGGRASSGTGGGGRGGGPAIVVLKDIRGGMIFQEGKPRLGFEAAKAEANPGTGDFKLMGGVLLTALRTEPTGPNTGPEATLEVPDLRWDARSERLECSGPVELRTRGVVVKGERVSGSMKDKTLVIEGNVRIFKMNGSLTCKRAIYRFEAGTLEIVGESELNIDMG
ncbi:MAG TPA: hypothetical protein GXX51_07560 [Firmicutes bacterium]|nr:hypothetical protein [Bacillota bacterium]